MEHSALSLSKIDDIILENKIYRFASELQHTANEDRKNDLHKILNLLQNKPDKKKPEIKSAKTKLTEIYSEMDAILLKKKWIKLSDMQKKNRITDFVKKNYNGEILQQDAIDKFFKMLDDGELKPKMVEYNNSEGFIISINVDDETSKSKSKPKSKKKLISCDDSE